MGSVAARDLWLAFDPPGGGPWVDCVPARRDLPRTLPDVTSLTIATEEPGVDGALHYGRTARPGQGRLTDRAASGLVVVLISPTDPARAQELRDWGDFVHLSHIAAAGVPGYTMVTPYEVVGDGPRFLHLYELDTDDPEAAFQAMTPLVRSRLDDATFRAWAWHDALRIDFVSTFRRER